MFSLRREDDGTLVLRVSFDEGVVLVALPSTLREILGDSARNHLLTRRLFPPAYSDPARNREYQRLLGEDLMRRKLESVEAFEASLSRRTSGPNHVEFRVRPEQLDLWLAFVNDMRLVLGTQLGICDDDWGRGIDPSDPDAADLALLHYLSWLEEEILRATGFQWEPPGLDPDDDPRSGAGEEG